MTKTKIVIPVIGIRVAGSNPETRKPLDCFTLRVRNDENRPNISAGIRGTSSEIRLLTHLPTFETDLNS
jgi:hypothetical protein